jgi:endo-1,4-beta-xylanase
VSPARRVGAGMLAAAVLTGGCARPPLAPVAPRASAPSTLRDAAPPSLLVGAAVNSAMAAGRDTLGAAIARTQFNAVTPENVLKWDTVHPRPGVFDFERADQLVGFAERNGMAVVGHVLVWHNQTPRWVFQDSTGHAVGRDTLLDRMREHIQAVVGRYRGRILGWDVVNEAVDEDGSLRRTPWLTIIGEDYIARAFEMAHQADPNAELYYNDYSLENAPKREGALALVRRLMAAGVPITGVGIQGHDHLDWPTAAQEDSTIGAFAALGLKVPITELDIDVLPRPTPRTGAEIADTARWRAGLDPYTAGLPDSVQRALAERYADLFALFLRYPWVVSRVTLWGVTDRTSWKNDWPLRGRTNYPLLFDRSGRPKPAFDAVLRVLQRAAASP